MPDIRRIARSAALILLILALPGHPLAQAMRLSNTATLSVGTGTDRREVRSNTVTLDVQPTAVTRRGTKLSFRLLPNDYPFKGLACDTSPTLVATGAPIDAAELAALPPMAVFDTRQPLAMVLDAPGENHDPARRENTFLDVNAGTQHQQLKLTETAPDSGVFAGGVPPLHAEGPRQNDCDIRLREGERFSLSFDGSDSSDPTSVSVLSDPAGHVFDSVNGALVDGATVTLLNEDGTPAEVFGDDGMSRYPNRMVTGQAVTDASGRVYPGVLGHYRFPLVRPARYILHVDPPANYVAPSTADLASLLQLMSTEGTRYILNDGSFERVFTVNANELFLADIPLDPVGSDALLLTKTASVREASMGDPVQYRLRLQNRAPRALAGVAITDTLPAGLRYRAGSTRGANEPALSADGRTLTFAVPRVASGTAAELSYLVTVAPGAPVGEAVNRARAAAANGVASNEAAAAVRLSAPLFTDALTLIGRVTEGPCTLPERERRGVPGVRVVTEDGRYVLTDLDGLYHIEGLTPGRHVVALDTGTLPPATAPIACDADTRAAGSSTSRFVEGDGGVVKRADFFLRRDQAAAAPAAAAPVSDDRFAAGDRDWMTGQAPGIAWLFPAEGYNPRSPAVRVAIKHRPGQRIALTVNGRQSDALAFDGTDTAGEVAVSRWSGIPLAEGDNRLDARVLDAEGRVVESLSRTVHLSGAPRRAVLDPAHSRLVADGATPPAIAVRVTDKDGRPAAAGTLVRFTVEDPYRPATDAALEQRRRAAGDATGATATVRVTGDEGIALLTLQPTSHAGAVRVTLPFAEAGVTRTSTMRTWLAAAPKQWTVVGFGAGTLGFDVLQKHRRALPAGQRDRLVTDGQLALYASGRIKGSWLLTAAFDSDRRYDPQRGLLGVIDPDRYYTVYGDGTQQAHDAATRRKLYLRLERREAYALFGDFETGMTETQLTRYSRTLNGVKAAYEGDTVRATAFAADPDTRYARDEIRGTGLSGPYRLSGRNIVPNSDKITIQVRNRLRSELIVSSRALVRHIDYDIDTDAGTIRFREPVLGRDADLNPVFIVADYEVEGGRTGQVAAGARVAARLLDDRIDLGASVLKDQTAGNATVAGADLKARLSDATELRGEIARGGRGGFASGIAFLAEAEHHGPVVDALAYVRQQDGDFGVGQQNAVEAGTRKFGIDGRVRLSDRIALTGSAWHQSLLDEAATRIAGDARLEYRRDTGTVYAGAQFARDRAAGQDRESRLLTVGGSQSLADGRLVLSTQLQVAPGGDKDSTAFPVRDQIGLSYRLTDGVRLTGAYELADGADATSHRAQIGFDVAPWAGAKLMATMNRQQIGENAGRSYAQYGLSQSLAVSRRWTVDATLDATTTTSGAVQRANAAVGLARLSTAAGSLFAADAERADYAAVTLGATYRAQSWTWNGRVEHRAEAGRDRWGITTSALRALGSGQTLAGSARAYRAADPIGGPATYADADVALALRPLGSRWSVLERLQLRHQAGEAGIGYGASTYGATTYGSTTYTGYATYAAGTQQTTRLINNLAVNYRTLAGEDGRGLEATLHYGAKYVRGRFADERVSGFVDVTAFDLRAGITRRIDIGVQASAQHGWTDGTLAWSAGPSVGVSPAGDMWITAGVNLAGFRDRDFEADRYTRAGPYVTMRLKFDQLGISRMLGKGAR